MGLVAGRKLACMEVMVVVMVAVLTWDQDMDMADSCTVVAIRSRVRVWVGINKAVRRMGASSCRVGGRVLVREVGV